MGDTARRGVGRRVRALAYALVVTVPLSGCGGLPRVDDAGPRSGSPGAASPGAAGARGAAGSAAVAAVARDGTGTRSAAAELRATLTGLLCEHAYLLGGTVAATVAAGGDGQAPAVRAARATQDAAAVALADALAVAYPEVRASFLSAWREGAGAAVALTEALVTGDRAAADAARAVLAAHPERVGALVGGAVPALPAAHVAAALTPATTALVTAVEAAAGGRPEAVLRLRAAAAPHAVLAAVLAQGIARDRGLEGAAGGAAAAVRAALTHLLVEHVHLTAAAARAAGADGASAALDGNARAFATAVGGVAPSTAPRLLAAWRAHTRALVRAGDGGSGPPRLLHDTRAAVGRALAGTGTLTAAAVAAELEPATATLAAALDGRATGQPGVPAQVREAGWHAAATAAYLSAGLLG